MSAIVVSSILLALSATSFASSEMDLFTEFVSKYNKIYETHTEMNNRLNIFKNNLKKIIEHNNSNDTFTMAINQFADLTPEEFKKYYAFTDLNEFNFELNNPYYADSNDTLAFRHTFCDEYDYEYNTYIPPSFDWREFNKVSSVKDQGQCGSCWAFSSIGAIESLYAITNNTLLDLSEQQLVDCSLKNNGCNGGDIDAAFNFAINTPIYLDSDYPYTAIDNKCNIVNSTKSIYINKCYDIPKGNELALTNAIYNQPVSVAIEADTSLFQFYSGGIINSKKCGTKLDHAVLAVGYGEENGLKYYIVKNSWSSKWGEDGYVRIARSTSENNAGICGIALSASFPK